MHAWGQLLWNSLIGSATPTATHRWFSVLIYFVNDAHPQVEIWWMPRATAPPTHLSGRLPTSRVAIGLFFFLSSQLWANNIPSTYVGFDHLISGISHSIAENSILTENFTAPPNPWNIKTRIVIQVHLHNEFSMTRQDFGCVDAQKQFLNSWYMLVAVTCEFALLKNPI